MKNEIKKCSFRKYSFVRFIFKRLFFVKFSLDFKIFSYCKTLYKISKHIVVIYQIIHNLYSRNIILSPTTHIHQSKRLETSLFLIIHYYPMFSMIIFGYTMILIMSLAILIFHLVLFFSAHSHC